MPLLSSYLTELRQELRDSGVVRTEEYIGNGTRETWILRNIPIITASVSVFLDGVATTSYTVNTTTGVLTFVHPVHAPADGTEIEVLYSSVKYSDSMIITYLKKAIEKVESIYTIGYAVTGTNEGDWTVDAPVSDLLQIWFEMAKFLLRRDNLKLATEDSVNWRDGDKAFDETPGVIAMRGLLTQQWDSIMWDLERLILEGTIGARKAGGATPEEYGSFAPTGPGNDEYLWWDGEISDTPIWEMPEGNPIPDD